MADQVSQDIKDRLNIADVIAGYIPIKKAGANFKALCPFHHEKTPSLQISPQKQIWHCFGCGEGGDVFGFVMKYENLEFREVLKVLAEKAGVKLLEYRPADPREQSEKDLLLRINDFAARFYHQFLLSDKRAEPAREYLKNRGLTAGTIAKWKIGFAPDDFHALETALHKKGAKPEDAVRAGVCARNERGQIYDRFRGRVTFPIFNYFGEVVGFSARILQDDGKSAKYVNSPETVIYSKSKILFGLNFAKNAIRKSDEVVVVEGQMDVIGPQQAGFENIVASSGTALTMDQLLLLGRLTKNLKFCFDGDAAGVAASRRAGELALKAGFRLKVIVLEKAKDPDELVRKSPGLWEKAVAEAKWFLDWQMDFAENAYPQDPVEQKHYLTQNVLPLLLAIADPLEQDHYIRQLAARFDISERTVREQVQRRVQGLPAPVRSDPPVPNGQSLEKELLGGMLAYPEFCQEALSQVQANEFSDPIIERLVTQLAAGQAGQIQDETVAKEAMFMVESQVQELQGGSQQQLRELGKSLALFKIRSIKKRQESLAERIKRAEQAQDKDQLRSLNQEFAVALKERMKYEKLI
ncbi:MAG: DNA primase [Patescibacteria group bacterium]|nr:DNA primase [Patescibacteria group bacterium]